MKVVILAGGRGTRLSEETGMVPKPMIEIGGKPILWHIMKIYSHYGYNEFIICLGYKGYMIKEYFSHYFSHMSDITIDLVNNKTIIHNTLSEPWKITLVNTGFDTFTGGRLKRIQSYIKNESFMMTYGDGVGNVNIKELVKNHKKSKKYVTLTAVKASERFGILDIKKDKSNILNSFNEKPEITDNWINAGFFVLEPEIFGYIKGDYTWWEKEPLESLAKNSQVVAYKHSGFWKPMDTLRDKNELEQLWQSNKALWKLWE
ncbi:MAG: glucose-1-phosphate cytidylyltransferase [bacterium]